MTDYDTTDEFGADERAPASDWRAILAFASPPRRPSGSTRPCVAGAWQAAWTRTRSCSGPIRLADVTAVLANVRYIRSEACRISSHGAKEDRRPQRSRLDDVHTMNGERYMDRRFFIAWVVLFVAFGWRAVSPGCTAPCCTPDYLAAAEPVPVARSDAQRHFPLMILAHVSSCPVHSYGPTRAARRTSALAGPVGLRYGIAVALLCLVPIYVIYYVAQPMPGSLATKQIVPDGILRLLSRRDRRVSLPRPCGPDGGTTGAHMKPANQGRAHRRWISRRPVTSSTRS